MSKVKIKKEATVVKQRSWDKNSLRKIQVLQRHIDTAVPANSGHCMIADAIKDGVLGASRITVDLQTIRFTDKVKRLRYEYLTPRPAQEALVDFDWGTAVKPFVFAIRTPRITAASVPKEASAEVKAMRVKNLKKASLAKKTKNEKTHGLASGVIGGRSSPTGALAAGSGRRRPAANYGGRREFGIRGLVRNRPAAKADEHK